MRRLIVLVVLALAAACAPEATTPETAAGPGTTAAPAATAAPATTEAPAEATRVVVASLPNAFLAALYVARDDGIFAEEGLEVEIVELESGLESVAAVVSGNAQYGDIGFDDLVALAQEGEESLVMLHNLVQRVTLTLVMRSEVAEDRGVSRESPLEERFAALEGLTLGVTSPGAATDNYMRYYLRQAGLDPDRDANIVAIGGGAALLAALEEGQIDAYHLSPPTPFVAENEGFGVILINGPEGDVPEFADFVYTGFAGNRTWAEDNPEAAQAFSRALRRAMEKVAAEPDAVAEQILDDLAATDVEIVRETLVALVPALSETGCFAQEAVADSLTTMLEAGITSAESSPEEGALWTNAYNDC
ncbi:MAG: ABC transporter substrate-binding protein [Acidimicrobiia bacterium]